MSNNSNLNRARDKKTDDFYTQLETIEAEVKYYKDHFKNKLVLCNCNDGPESSFTQYFREHFEELGLKQLVTTSYEDALRGKRRALKYEYTGPEEVTKTPLESGDYGSPECLKLLDEADIVVTNPPFSKFRDFLETLIEHEKKFLILSNLNTIFCKKPFGYFMEGLWWLGVSNRKGGIKFEIPKEYTANKIENEYREFGSIRWITNLEHGFEPPEIPLTKSYNSNDFPTYDTYPAINVDKTKDIPKDYNGLMGVPISFIDKYNSNQFEIKGITGCGNGIGYDLAKPIVGGKEKYRRIIIKRR